MDGDLVHILGFPILGSNGDFKHGVAATAAQVLPVDSADGARHRFRYESDGIHLIGNGHGIFQTPRGKARLQLANIRG